MRKYNERAIRPGTKINKVIKYADDWFLNKHVMIDDNGNLVEAINDADELQWQQDNTINDIDYYKFSDITTKDCFTKRLGSELCEDLGLATLKWDDCKEWKLNGYLQAVFNILRSSNEMPKVRHRHRGNDNESEANSRLIVDYVNLTGGQTWGTLGNNDEERKEALVRKAKDEEKGKALRKLLKCKRSYKEIMGNAQQTFTPNTAIPQVVQLTQMGVFPTVTMPPSVEKIKLYPGASQEWKKKLPWWDHFSDWLNRKWFRFRFKNEIYYGKAAYKAAYDNCCNRDWDTGAPTR